MLSQEALKELVIKSRKLKSKHASKEDTNKKEGQNAQIPRWTRFFNFKPL